MHQNGDDFQFALDSKVVPTLLTLLAAHVSDGSTNVMYHTLNCLVNIVLDESAGRMQAFDCSIVKILNVSNCYISVVNLSYFLHFKLCRIWYTVRRRSLCPTWRVRWSMV
jgi:hypothetical protein